MGIISSIFGTVTSDNGSQRLQQTRLGIPKEHISILTYNILANAYSGYIKGVPKKHLDSAYRKNLILNQLYAFNTDFICLQELDSYSTDLKPFFESHGYDSYYLKRNSSWNPDGSVVAWKSDLYEYIDSKDILYNDHEKCKANKAYKRNNIGVLVVLKSKETQRLIIIGSTHFYWDPQFEYVKFLQATILVKEAFILKDQYKCPMILNGDLNSTPDSSTMNFLLGRELNLSSGNMIDNEILTMVCENPLKLRSAYENYSESGNPEFTNYTADFKATIDFILYSEELKVEKLGKLPSLEDLKSVISLPNSEHPSDHLPLSAHFSLQI